MRSQPASAAVKYLVGASIPRSGHHFLESILKRYYEDELFYCENYTVKDCCKFTPCTRSGKHRIVYQKSHDFNSELPQHISDVLYIIQFREPVAQIISNFELELKNSAILDRATKEHFSWFLAVKGAYYRRFYDKWLRVRYANAVYLDYDDLVTDPGSAVGTIVERIDGAINSKKLSAITAALRSSAFTPRVVESSPYFDAQLLGAYEDYVLRHCPGLPFHRRFAGDYREHELWGLLLLTDHGQRLPRDQVDRLSAAATRAPQHPQVRLRLARRELRGGNEAAALELLDDLLIKENPFFRRVRQYLAVASKEDGWLLPEPLRDAAPGAFPTKGTAANEAVSEASAGRHAVTAAGQDPLASSTSGGKYPIAIMSFNRPAYLKQVLHSLRAQTNVQINDRPIYLFQDGATNPYSGQRYADEQDLNSCVDLFTDYFPFGIVFRSPINLGVALNFERAERFIFEEIAASAGIFLEDDLVLEPQYITTLTRLIEEFCEDSRVSYVAAYGDHTQPIGRQIENKNRLINLTHNWGFALFRDKWLEMRPFVLEYLKIVEDADYNRRDLHAIATLFRNWGFGCPASSQDAAKTLASCKIGAVKLNTFICNGVYIGEQGLHMNPKLFERRGYKETEPYSGDVPVFEALDEPRYRALFHDQTAWARSIVAGMETAAAVVLGGAPDAATPDKILVDQIVTALYRAVLGRDPDPSGLTAYSRLFRGRSLPAAIQTMVERLLTSQEYKRRTVAVLNDVDNDLGPRNLPEILEYNGEFGPEIILFRPFMAWLSRSGLLRNRTIRTYEGMSCFYRNLDYKLLIEKADRRSFVDFSKRPGFLPVKCEHNFDNQPISPFLVYEDFRKIFVSVELGEPLKRELLERPLLVIHNKITNEWGEGPINNIPVDALEEVFRRFSALYRIVYIRHGVRESTFEDHLQYIPDTQDVELIKEYRIDTFQELYERNLTSGGTRDINEFKCGIYARCWHFLTSQGGGAHQICCFSGSLMMIFHKAGSEEAWAYGDGYYGFASNPAPIRTIFRSSSQLRDGLALLENPQIAAGRAVIQGPAIDIMNRYSPTQLRANRGRQGDR